MTEVYATAGIIAFGDELLTGQGIDTNSAWLSERLVETGLRVRFHAAIGDDLEDGVQAVRDATQRADVVILTGGLGPTRDDLTRDVLSQLSGQPLVTNAEALAHLNEVFARRKRPMPERNLLQALLPQGARLVPNPHGTAPGIDLQIERPGRLSARIFALPGVPAEMQQMWEQSVRPRLLAECGLDRRFLKSTVLKVFGKGESELEELIGDLIERHHRPRVGITVSRATIALRILAEAESSQECDEQLHRTRSTIEQRLGDLVFGEGSNLELPQVLMDQLRQRKETLCVLEIGHDALLTQWLSSMEAADVFRGGLHLSDHACLARVARSFGSEPAELGPIWQAACDADWLVLIDEYPVAGAKAGTLMPACELRIVIRRRPQGNLHEGETAVSRLEPGAVWEHRMELAGHPDVLRHRIAKHGLDWLRRSLRETARGTSS